MNRTSATSLTTWCWATVQPCQRPGSVRPAWNPGPFLLREPLRGPDGTVDDVHAATEAVGALEIVDSRIADWKLTHPDTVADNASSARGAR